VYALAIIRYRRPIEEVQAVSDAHSAYLKDLHTQGIVLVAGRLDPRYGGALILRVADVAALDKVRDDDPYVLAGVAQYELLPWAPGIGKDAMDAIIAVS
jgi:uncharacterized protein YciI